MMQHVRIPMNQFYFLHLENHFTKTPFVLSMLPEVYNINYRFFCSDHKASALFDINSVISKSISSWLRNKSDVECVIEL
jgi:hypothetical protein